MKRRGRNKFNAKRTKVDGIWFHSAMESRRYLELKILEKAKKITDLTLQPKFVLTAGFTPLGKMVADFQYFDVALGERVTEDVKGRDNPMSRWKRKHAEAQYGIKVKLVTYVR